MKRTSSEASETTKAKPVKRFELIKVGNVTLKIYKHQRATTTGNVRTVFTYADKSTGKRVLKSFSTLEAAKAAAALVASKESGVQTTAANLRTEDAASYARSLQLLRPTGVSLELAAATFARAFAVLGGEKILAAAEYFARQSPDNLTPRTVAEVVAELVATKVTTRTENTVSDLRNRLGIFAKAFACNIASVTTTDVQRWLDGLKVTDRTRLNYRLKVSQLFTFAERRGYIPKHGNPVDHTERPEPQNSEVTIYSTKEVGALLAAASDAFRPCLALAAFAGLRTSEILRLNWEDIDLVRGHIKASGRKRGTPSRRFVPLTANLRAWLAPYAGRTGLVWQKSESDRKYAEDLYSAAQIATAAAAEIPWKKNALRHSFISYRLAENENANAAALEAGNSAGTIFKHYRELVTKAEAVAWFAVSPALPENVTTLPAAVEA